MDAISRLGGAVDAGFVLTVFLLSIRLGALLTLTPVLHAAAVPASVRVLIVIGLASALALGLPDAAFASARSLRQPGAVLAAALSELALGATLAFGVFAAFAAISMAGRLIDVQIGFGMAQVLDPLTRRQVPVLTSAFDHLGILVFFLVDGHHALLRGLAYTLERFPPGSPWPLEAAMPMVAQQLAALFTLGFSLAAPVVVCLLMAELVMGVVSRNLPQINMFVIGIPVKTVAGLAMLAMWFAVMGDSMNRIYLHMFRAWQSAFDAMPVPGVR